MKNKIAVYTAITNGYDSLKDPIHLSKDIDYICFTDNPNIKSSIWEVVAIPNNDLDEVRKCRQIKILPHIFLKDYQYSIWIDGNIDIISDINELVSEYFERKKCDLVTFKHPFRDCIYEEAMECIKLKKDDEKIILKQMEKYEKNNYPKNAGLIESNVILRRHNSPHVMKVMEDWWQEVENFSRRDQLSFNYVAWLNKFNYDFLPGNSRNNSKYFNVRYHKKNKYREMLRILKKRVKGIFVND